LARHKMVWSTNPGILQLERNFKRKMAAEERASGISPEPNPPVPKLGSTIKTFIGPLSSSYAATLTWCFALSLQMFYTSLLVLTEVLCRT